MESFFTVSNSTHDVVNVINKERDNEYKKYGNYEDNYATTYSSIIIF